MALWLGDGKRCLEPNHEMRDVRRCSIWPVIAKNVIIGVAAEWSVTLGLEAAACIIGMGTRRDPVQAFLANEIGNTSICSFDLIRPGEVPAQLRRVPLKCGEIVGS